MPVKIRKQIYIEPRHQRMLKRVSKKTGTPEAEIIRCALDEHLHELQTAATRAEIWKREMAFIKQRMGQGPLPGGRNWNRDDLHDR